MHETSWSGERRVPERQSGVGWRGPRFKAMLVLAVVAIAVLGFRTFGDPESSGEDFTVLSAAPEELVGTWVTDNRRYAGSALVIGHDHIELDPGAEGEIQSHPMLSIRAAQGAETGTYEIDYETAGGPVTMEVHLQQDGLLRLRNPPDVMWRRKPTG